MVGTDKKEFSQLLDGQILLIVGVDVGFDLCAQFILLAVVFGTVFADHLLGQFEHRQHELLADVQVQRCLLVGLPQDDLQEGREVVKLCRTVENRGFTVRDDVVGRQIGQLQALDAQADGLVGFVGFGELVVHHTAVAQNDVTGANGVALGADRVMPGACEQQQNLGDIGVTVHDLLVSVGPILVADAVKTGLAGK